MSHLPAGRVTFLFTDIEGSIRLLHALGDRYAEVLMDHRRLLRATFATHGGSIPVARFAPGGDLVIDNLADTAKRPTDLRTWEQFACRIAGRELTRAEWSGLLPGRPYRRFCPHEQ